MKNMNITIIYGTLIIVCGMANIFLGAQALRQGLRERSGYLRTKSDVGCGIESLGINADARSMVGMQLYNTVDQVMAISIGWYVADDSITVFQQDGDIEMPCGSKWTVKKGDPIPDKDLPCPCGDQRHWLFRRSQPKKIIPTNDGHGPGTPTNLSIERTNLLPTQSWANTEEWRKANDAAWAEKLAKENQ